MGVRALKVNEKWMDRRIHLLPSVVSHRAGVVRRNTQHRDHLQMGIQRRDSSYERVEGE